MMSCPLGVLGPLVRHAKQARLLVGNSVGLMVAGGGCCECVGTLEALGRWRRYGAKSWRR